MRKYQRFFILVLVGLLVPAINAVADPPACNNTWIGTTDFWKTPEKWSLGHTPTNDEVACILNGAYVIAGYSGSGVDRAKAIYADATSELAIYGGGTDDLTLCGGTSCVASQVDGEFEIYYGNGKLILGQNVTINGSGTIELGFDGGNINSPAIIEATSGTPTLTIAGGITLEGRGDIKVKLVNNGKVVAEYGSLKLVEGGDGAGTWSAAGSTGHLLVQKEVKGSGKWELADNASARIEIDAACECLTGVVQLAQGILDVDANFRTTGQFALSYYGLVDVAAGATAQFSMPSQPLGCYEGGGGAD